MSPPRDDGFTLAEVLVALTILGIASVALVGAMGNLVLSSSIHRGFSSTDTLARAYMEDAQSLANTTTWSCTMHLSPATVTTGYIVTTTWEWLDPTTGVALTAANPPPHPAPDQIQETACTEYAAAKCPAETSPYPPECTSGAIRLSLKVNKPGGAGHTTVETDTQTILRRANA